MSNPPQFLSVDKSARPAFDGARVWILCALAGLVLIAAFLGDARVLKLVADYSSGWSRWFAGRVSYWGDWYGVVGIGLCAWCWARRVGNARWQRLVLTMGICAALGGMGANIVRSCTGRARPNANAAPGWYGPAKGLRFSRAAREYQSFPSAHTGVVAGFCAPLGIVALKSHRRRRRVSGMAVAIVGTALMAWARVWVGAHHLSDVVASVILGWGIGLGWIARRWRCEADDFISNRSEMRNS